MSEWIGIVFVLVCIALVCLPPRFDPAIRWKERNERKAEERRARQMAGRIAEPSDV